MFLFLLSSEDSFSVLGLSFIFVEQCGLVPSFAFPNPDAVPHTRSIGGEGLNWESTQDGSEAGGRAR